MLTIRDNQIAAIAADVRQRFLDEAVAMVREHWPRKCATAGAKETRALVEQAIAAAKSHGFDDQRDILRYVNVVMAHGLDFTSDVRFRDAAELLERIDVQPAAKIELVADAARDALRQRAGA